MMGNNLNFIINRIKTGKDLIFPRDVCKTFMPPPLKTSAKKIKLQIIESSVKKMNGTCK